MAKSQETQYEIYGCFRLAEQWLDKYLFITDRIACRPEKFNKEIGSGSWIQVLDVQPLAVNPHKGGIYYALPALYGTSIGYRKDGRYLIIIKVESFGRLEDVYLYPNEYKVITDDELENLNKLNKLECVLYSSSTISKEITEANKELDKWRLEYINMHEDERNILDGYMLDGLTFDQACFMYYTERYSNQKGFAFWFKSN